MSEDKIVSLKRMLESAKSAISSAEEILKDLVGGDITAFSADYESEAKKVGSMSEEGRVIEGVFDGEKMMGPDGKEYPVPANYSSKSKLVPGDVLKLTIADDGRLMYKQIGPVARKSVVGTLVREGNQFGVTVDDKMYKVLLASVTYYKADVGDQVTLIVPEEESGEWGSIEAVLPSAS
jgi:hypothetical protein